jgi:monovalent cation/hydrogen antiporter
VDNFEPILFGLLVAVAALSVVARRLRVPYPILLVLGGLALSLIPHVPRLELRPDLVLVLFLPPLLYVAAFFANLRGFRADLRAISLLSVGLVVATAAAVAAVAHTLVGLPWSVAFTLGAIVSPTDPLAATQILGRLGAPRRTATVLEGEGLINDGVALVLYRAALGAAVGQGLSLGEVGLRVVLAPLGGALIGLAVGWIVAWVRQRIDDPPTSITISLFTGFAAYLPAEALGVSGVIAAVVSGIYVGWRGPEIASPATRLQGFAVWEIVQFLLNSLLFVLIGLQLPVVIDGLGGQSVPRLLAYGAALSGVVIAVRIVWVFATTVIVRAVDRRPAQRERRGSWQDRMIVGWSGMRGAVSLAAALAIPTHTDVGAPFPGREMVLFLTFSVILATLVVQGLSLPLLIRRLGVRDDGEEEREELRARLAAAKAALARIDELADEEWTRPDTVERMRGFFEWRKRRLAARAGKLEDEGYEDQSLAYQRMQREVLQAQRRAVVGLRNQGVISNDVMHRIERELDLEDSRLEERVPPADGGAADAEGSRRRRRWPFGAARGDGRYREDAPS